MSKVRLWWVAGIGSVLLGVAAALAQERVALDLQKSVELALTQNERLVVAREKVGEAAARVGEARTGFFPQLRGSASYSRLDVAPFMPGRIFEGFSKNLPQIPGMPPQTFPKRIPIGRDEIVGIGITLQQPLFTGGRLFNGYRMAQEGEKIAEAGLEKDEGDLILEVKKAYWGAVKAEKMVEVAHQGVQRMEAYLQDLQNMYDVGMLTKNDLLKAKVQLANVRLMEIQVQHGRRLAMEALCMLLGLPLDTELELTERLEHVPPVEVDLAEAREIALRQRPEVRMMEHNQRMSQKAVQMASAGWLPSVALVLDYGYKRPDREYNPDFYATWTATVAAQINLFDWGATRYKQEQAERQLRQVRASLSALKDGIALEVTQAILAINEAKQSLAIAEENVAQAEENYKVTLDKFHEGMVTNTEVLDANSLLVKARTDHVSALADYQIALARLDRALGRTVTERTAN
ncbi:MAG: TolC family protein [candidate division KSB1 bacterium]|nr:TolC family protein [candidate division KSB1 bacterium]MDZ7386096.1 TolC family protein [candidate division KSB1 bacterium]MDZ7391891.1 TolC family protein [candidate division KSB1 bacterium]